MPPPTQPPPQHLHLKKPTSLPDVIFTAFSLFFLYSTKPKPTNKKIQSFPFSPPKFPKMSSNPRSHVTFATPQSLSDYLKPRLQPDSFTSWGIKPGTKNIHNLWLEISQGETFLSGSIPPVRTVEVVIVKIINKNKRVLIESHQELSNGVVRERCRPLSEKMKPGESVEDAVYRAVKEELGSVVKVESLGRNVRILEGSYSRKVEERGSVSYPGLPARYVLHSVEAEVEGLPEDEFCTEEGDEYEGCEEEKGVADSAVSCRKHYWKWVDSESV